MKTNRDEIIAMAREADCVHVNLNGDHAVAVERMTRFYVLATAKEREKTAKHRGVLLFNPYSGKPRHPSDIASDPHGILMLDPDQPLRAAIRARSEG